MHIKQSFERVLYFLQIAAACHDLNHPGLNNAFLVNIEDPIAILYNDLSVLENTHASRSFDIMHHEQYDFLEDVEIET